jgi:hypothetical protein
MKRTGRPKSASKATKQRARPPQPKLGMVSLHKAPPRVRASVLRGIHRVLQDHGIAGRVAAVHLEPAAAAADVTAADPNMCPPGTIRRVVCVRQPDGTLSCEEKCTPV